MLRVPRPANQTALGSCLRAKVACFCWYDRYRQARILTLMCTKLPDGGHYMITAAMREFGTPHCPKYEIPNLSI